MRTLGLCMVGCLVLAACATTPMPTRESVAPQEGKEQPKLRMPVLVMDAAAAGLALEEARVVRVSDGDTVLVEFDEHGDGTLDRVKVRLIAVSTPEIGERYSKKAAAFLAELVLERTVFMECEGLEEQSASGHYPRRLLRHLYVEDEQTGERIHVNAALVEAGLAVTDLHGNIRYKEKFEALQQAARDARRGRWRGRPRTVSRSDNSVGPRFILYSIYARFIDGFDKWG